MSKKLRIGIFFGGKSLEHEISILSAKNIFQLLDKQKYHPVPIAIAKNGEMFYCDSKFLLEKTKELIGFTAQNPHIISKLNITDFVSFANKHKIDVAFPILHGAFGEDGIIQGLFKLANIPFVGAGVAGSAVGMDKDIMNRLLRDANIPIANFICCKKETLPSFNTVAKTIGLPFFIKPANAGSSVGINKVSSKKDYLKFAAYAFKYDTKILLEETIKGREVEVAVLGNDQPIASLPGEVIPTHEFYSYAAKYIDEQGANFQIPVKLPKPLIKKIQNLAVKSFQVLNCEGLARVDFFLRGNEVLVNEINTIPGFTSISMYPKLWEVSGIPGKKLVDKLIQLALERFKQEQKLELEYDGIKPQIS